jgi:uncharacterized lipoprotein YajG
VRKSWIVPILIILLAPGCAWTPQAILPKPEIHSPVGSVGQGTSVSITVLDERSKSVLGSRAVRGVGADITLEGDLAAIVRSAISDGLQRQGFMLISNITPENRELRVEIRDLSYTISQGAWMGGLHVECALKALCTSGPTRLYENFYRGVLKENVGRVPTESENEQYVNSAISSAIDSLLQDPLLIQALAQ